MGRHFLVIGFILFVFIMSLGCQDKESHQNSMKLTKDLDVITIDTTNIPFSIILNRETVFESNDKVFIDGYIGQLAVDNEDRVFISATKPGMVGIYVFEPNGSFITKFTNEGRGPGEFESIGSISIRRNEIYVFGPRLQKFGVFSTQNFKFLWDQIIRKDSIPQNDELTRLLRINKLYLTEKGEIIARLSNLSLSEENQVNKVIFHKISEEGYVLPERILELKKYRFYFGRNTSYPVLFPFQRNSLISVNSDGSFHTAWSQDFLIRNYDREGRYQKSYKMEYDNAPLSTKNLELSKQKRNVLTENEPPENWQVLHTLEVDDQNRMWVSTISESKDLFKWWVINEEGEVLATFKKSGKRSEISIMSKPLYKIKNGYFYELERDIRKGIDRIIKYKIEFTDR